MLRVNPKMLVLGASMLTVGFVLVMYLSQMTPVGEHGMTGTEITDLFIAEQQNSGYITLASIIVGVGFLFLLLSFGTARGEGGAKPRKAKPDASEPPQT